MRKRSLFVATVLAGILTLGGASLSVQAAWENNDGAVQYRDDTTGQLVDGWRFIDGNYYYFDPISKSILTGFQDIGTNTYYFDSTGKMYTGVQQINGELYYFNSNGAQRKGGWIQVGNIWYFAQDGKLLRNGMFKIGTCYYYFDGNGKMGTNCWKNINNTWYFFRGEDGHAYTNCLVKIGTCYYYFDPEGKMQTGWFTTPGGDTYYANTSGHILMNQMVDDHFVNGDGRMRTSSWLSYNYVWYFFDENGNMIKNTFAKIGSKTYYFDPEGHMVTGFREINGSLYYFNDSGHRASGEFQVNGSTYYASTVSGILVRNGWAAEKQFGPDGKWTGIHSGWNLVGGNWYFYSTTGTKSVGFQLIGTKTYYFDGNGVMLSGLQTINGSTYYFNSSGHMTINQTISIGDAKYTFGGDGRMTSYEIITLGQQIVDFAVQFVGNKYVYGGTSLTNGCDCSGFTMSVLAHFGISIPHYTGSQLNDPKGTRISPTLSNLLPGDLIFYYSDYHHVAIYMGDGQVVHASNSAPYPQGGIKISKWNYNTPTAAVRFWS